MIRFVADKIKLAALGRPYASVLSIIARNLAELSLDQYIY